MPRRVNLDELESAAMATLFEFLDKPQLARDPDATRRARIAASTLSSCATYRQADNNAAALRLAAARELPENDRRRKLLLQEATQ